MPETEDDNQESNSKRMKREESSKRLNGRIFTRMKFGSWRDINETSGKQRCKAVIIENCPTLHDIVVTLENSSYIDFLADWEVFIVVLSLSGPLSINEVTLSQISKLIKNPLILQLNYENEKIIFFKEENEEFKRLELLKDKIEESSIVNGLNFGFMCNLLHFGTNIGIFNFNLPETEVAMEKSICGFRLIDWAVKHNNMLCLMFLQLFDPNFESTNESSTRLLEVAAEFGTKKSFEIMFGTAIMGQSQKRILNLITENHENVLMIAVRSANIEIVTFLIECGLNVNLSNINGNTMSDVAWAKYTNSSRETPSDSKSSNKNLDILIKLLYNDAPFPKNFDKSQIESKVHETRYKMLISDRQNFHDAICNGQLAQVQSFTENNKLKFAYDVNNQCALTTAIASKKFEIYSFLRSKGFSDGLDYSLEFHLQLLGKNEKANLRKCNLKYFETNESQHIMDLVSKSRLAFGSKQSKFSEIQRLFEILDDIPEISSILKIVASSDQTDIIFDFSSSSVGEMDPTGSEHVYGRTLFKSGNILIGARRETENMLLGTLAHELTHYAMQLVYNNKCLPFKFDDESRESEFKRLLKLMTTPEYKSRNEIIERAFQSNYDLKRKMAELIVRVPHLIAVHRNEPKALAEIREEFSLLFDFFEQKTLPDLEKKADLIKPKRDIRGANAKLGLYYKAAQSNWLSDAFFPSIDISKHIFVESSVPDLVLESFVKSLQFAENEIDSKNIFVNLEQMFIKENFEMLTSAAESEALQKIFIIEDSGKPKSKIFEDGWKSLFNHCVIVFISNINNSTFLKLFPSKANFDLDWSNLSVESKSKIMNSKVTFQDHEVTLREIVDEELILEDVPLELLVEPSKLKLKSFTESLPAPPRVFIERSFESVFFWGAKRRLYKAPVFHERDSKECKTENICDILMELKIIIIADSAGMGKSTSAAQIARILKLLDPSSWVVFIDLKAHTEAFVRDYQPRTGTIDVEYFSQKLLKLQNIFEKKLFESFFEHRKVIFAIDGFDEISPNYKQFVMEILKTIQSSDNQLLVTTRPHLVEELQEKLNASVFKFMPFTEKDQIKFLTKYWQHTTIKKLNVKSLLRKFKLDWYYDFYSTPIHIFMLTEVLECQGLKNLNDIKMDVFSLYNDFIIMKLKVWMSKGQLAQDENVAIQDSSANLRQIFHNLALKQIFDADDLKELNLSEITEEIENEMVLRVGIVNFGRDGIFQFTHRTFAEYFTADFVLRGVISKTPQNAVLNLFFKSLTNHNLEEVRKFINQGLCHFVKKMNLEALSRHFEGKIFSFIPVDEKTSILSKLVFENHLNLVAFVLEVLILTKNAKIKLVKNILLEGIEDTESFQVIWKCFKNFKESVQKNILFARKGDETILYRAVRKIQSLKKFLEIAMSSLNEEEFLKLILGEEGDRFQFYNHALSYWGALKEIWAAAKCKLGTENLKNLAKGKSMSGNTILLSFDGEPRSSFFHDFLWWLEDVKNILTSDELSELITAENDSGLILLAKTFHLFESKQFEALWKFIEENVNEADKKKIIFHEDNKKKFLIKLSPKDETERVCESCCEITKPMFQKNLKNAYFIERDKLIKFVFHTAICSFSLFEKISAKLVKDELRTILLGRTWEGENIFYCLLWYNKNVDNLFFWNLIIDTIKNVQAVKNLLLEKGSSYNQNVFHLAARLNKDILFDILDWCKINFCKEDFKNIFLEKNQNFCDFTLLHECCDYYREDSIQKCFDFVENNFSSEDRDLIFSLRDDADRTPHIVQEDRIWPKKLSMTASDDSSDIL